MIYYKVVTKTSRYSCMLGARSKYSLKYEKGTIVEALPDTLGIFVFKTKDAAVDFNNGRYLKNKRKIILVRGIGEGEIPNYIACVGFHKDCNYTLRHFYGIKNKNLRDTTSAPNQTILFKKVEVLT